MELLATGVAAHGSTPHEGDSAAIRILGVLAELPLATADWWRGILSLAEPSGAGLDLADADDVSGATTCNLGVIELAGAQLRMTFDIRHPVSRDSDWVRRQVAGPLSAVGLSLTDTREFPKLYYPLDSPLVQTILAVYDAETHEGLPPASRGAKSYACYLPNCVAVGRNQPGETETNVHGPDESYTFRSLRGAGRMLARLLIRLART